MHVSRGKALELHWSHHLVVFFLCSSCFCFPGVISAVLVLHLPNMVPLRWQRLSGLNLF